MVPIVRARIRDLKFLVLPDPVVKLRLRVQQTKMPAYSRSGDHKNAGIDGERTRLFTEERRERIVVIFLIREDLLEEQPGRGIAFR